MSKRWIQETATGFRVVDCDRYKWWEVSSFIEAVKMFKAIDRFTNALSQLNEINKRYEVKRCKRI